MGGPKTKRRGFSLIELLVVIAIIAILAGLIFPLATSMSERSKQFSCLTNLQSVGQALKLYRLDERSYPPALYGFMYEGDTVATTFLYPHYAKSRREFKCPDNPNRFNETKLAGPFEGSLMPNAVPQQRVPNPGGGYTVKPITTRRIAYYLFDSYDGGNLPPQRLAPGNVGFPGYELHYRRDWAYFGAADSDRELLNRNPEDATFVTACTYHRHYVYDYDVSPPAQKLPSGAQAADSWDMVLFLDGHTEKIPSCDVGPKVEPRG